MARDTTPDGRRTARHATADDTATSVMASGAAAPGLAAGSVRLRRGSASLLDDLRVGGSGIGSIGATSSISSLPSPAAALNAANLHANAGHPGTCSGSPAAASVFRRRSSNFSDYSQDARELLNPRPLDGPSEALRHHEPTSSWDSLPLALALLPAVGGLLVQGGSSFVTDLMLLCLGGIFLHWSVTQPWTWYHAAQQIREEHEANAEFAVHTGSDSDSDSAAADDRPSAPRPPTPAALEDVQEEEAEVEGPPPGPADTDTSPQAPKPLTPDERVAAYNKKQRERAKLERRAFQARQAAALRALFRHEVLALLSCFVCPVLGAYLLHALRGHLSRPSEGLISNFNLTIFLLGAEVRPLRHVLQLVQAHTLHLQRVVHANPYREEEERYRERREYEEREQNQTLSDLLHRLDRLEHQQQLAAGSGTPSAAAGPRRTAPTAHPPPPPPPPLEAAAAGASEAAQHNGTPPPPLHRSPSDARRDRDRLLRELRAQLQPELDSLARALRRTHKQQTLLEGQVAAKFRTTDQRLLDAASLASAVAAGGGGAGRGSGLPHGYSRRRQEFAFSSASSSSSPSPLLSPGGLVDTAWAGSLLVFDLAVDLLLYLPRRVTAAAAAVVALPFWAAQGILGGGSGGGGSTKGNGHDETAHDRKAGRLSRVGKGGRGSTPSPSSPREGRKARAGAQLQHDLAVDYAEVHTSWARQQAHQYGPG